MRDGNGIFYYMHNGDQMLAPTMSAATWLSVFCAILASERASHNVGLDSPREAEPNGYHEVRDHENDQVPR